jgi:hypothetical protein
MAHRTAGQRYVIIHGHFYQPPRENPWTGHVDRQPSAHPHHDWNERILDQCYAPNASSRLLNGTGEIDGIVNNYEDISFNIGPTLFAWLDAEHPDVARRIVAGDAASQTRLERCGNAIAQVHGHLILPLADDHDRVTQLAWGRSEFQHRFGRAPAGVWLSETAIDRKTADAVIEAGFRFVILSPHQAARVRPLASGSGASPGAPVARGAASGAAPGDAEPSGPWTDVSATMPDPFRPYLLRHSRAPADGRWLAVFFYHADLSRAVAFEGVLKNADAFAARIHAAFGAPSPEPRMLVVATDGESYGHHEPFGDMCLAALTRLKLPALSLVPANPELVLRRVPITHEVELKTGADGHGTAWSCSHGVGRWMRHCGCSTGAHPAWTQRWREPLREGLDRLAAELKRIYFAFTSRYFRDPWAARDHYIEVMLDGHAPATRERFLAEHLSKDASEQTCQELVALLSSQAFAQAMFTSCGWFFDDIAGLEPVQNLRYAARAIQLAAPHSRADLNETLAHDLRRARSNLPHLHDGEQVYRTWVLPGVMDAPRLAARELLVRASRSAWLASRGVEARVEEAPTHHAADGDEHAGSTARGSIDLTDRTTGRVDRFRFSIAPVDPVGARVSLVGGSPRARRPALSWVAYERDVQEALVAEMLRVRLRRADAVIRRSLTRAVPTLKLLKESGLPAPAVLATVARRALEAEVECAVRRIRSRGHAASERLDTVRNAFVRSRELGLDPLPGSRSPLGFPAALSRILSRALTHAVERASHHLLRHDVEARALEEAIDEARAILDLERDFGVALQRSAAENAMHRLATVDLPHWIERVAPFGRPVPEDARREARHLIELAQRFNFSPASVKAALDRIGGT